MTNIPSSQHGYLQEVCEIHLQQVSATKEANWDYRAHLLMECGDISASVSADLGDSVRGSVHLWRLEAVEHLPALPSEMASSAARLHEVCISNSALSKSLHPEGSRCFLCVTDVIHMAESLPAP